MRQYLLAVHMIEGEPIPPEEEIQQAVQGGRRVQRRAPVRRGLGLRRRPPPARHGHGRPLPERAGGHHRRAVRGDQGAAGRLLGHRGPRPGRRARLGGQGIRGLRRAGGGPAVPGDRRGVGSAGRGCRRRRARLPGKLGPCRGHPGPRLRRHRHRRGRGPGGLRRGRAALARRGRAAQPGRLDRHHGPQQGAGPPAAGVVPPRPRGTGGPAAGRHRSAGGGTGAR